MERPEAEGMPGPQDPERFSFWVFLVTLLWCMLYNSAICLTLFHVWAACELAKLKAISKIGTIAFERYSRGVV